MSESKLGELLGVTFHRLNLTARVLEVSPLYFLEGIIAPLTPHRNPRRLGPKLRDERLGSSKVSPYPCSPSASRHKRQPFFVHSA